MIALVLMLIMSAQGVSATPEAGRVTGVLRTTAGAPASKVRVSVKLSSENPADAALVGLGETDETGYFVLENIPPGRYYVIAGRVDRPTIYPGTLEAANGTIITVGAGATVEGIDFAIAESSYRPSSPEFLTPRITQITVPVIVTVEGGGQIPIPADAQSATIHLTPVAGGKDLQTPLNSAGVSVPITPGVTEEYHVRVENLPAGYVVKSIKFDSTDLTTDTLKASLGTLGQTPATPQIVTFTGEGELQRIIDSITQRPQASRKLLIILASAP